MQPSFLVWGLRPSCPPVVLRAGLQEGTLKLGQPLIEPQTQCSARQPCADPPAWGTGRAAPTELLQALPVYRFCWHSAGVLAHVTGLRVEPYLRLPAHVSGF